MGLKLEGALDFREGDNEWRNSANLMVAYSRTPQLPEYVKTEDTLSLESLYMFHLSGYDWFGPFVKANLETAIIDGYDTRTQENV